MKTVVLVEDDAMVALAFGIRLKAMGYLVHTACDAITAMSQVRKLRPDVVVLDISLPGDDGFVLAERINSLASKVATPIIFMTASQHPDLRKRAMELGAVGFLHKPFDANALADAIERALSPRDK
jgi:DNA-binding response OmpR family regulator